MFEIGKLPNPTLSIAEFVSYRVAINMSIVAKEKKSKPFQFEFANTL